MKHSSKTLVKEEHSHLADKSILIHRPSLATVGQPGGLSPHLLNILKNHVAVAVKGLDASEQLAVVADGDQDLDVGADGSLQDGQGTGRELVLLELGNLILAVLCQCRSR